MNERPILFTPENAQKVHVGTKTQTRRIMKPQPIIKNGRANISIEKAWSYAIYNYDWPEGGPVNDRLIKEQCPYGTVGDRLWVREASARFDNNGSQGFIYKGWPQFAGMTSFDWKWTPSLHMPRIACRTVLELTEIRVEQVREISFADAQAEGCSDPLAPVLQFSLLWNSINGPTSWNDNPYVWVLTFKKVDA